MEGKPALRARLLRRREQRTDAELAASGAALAAHGRHAWSAAMTVAAFVDAGREPPTRPLLDALSAAGVTVLLPRVDGTALQWATYDGPASLRPGSFGLWEPSGPALSADALDGTDVVVVPALAVDRAGHRLGRGGGYYDRALAGVRRPVVAVVFDDELLDEVPAEPHDVPVAAVLSPERGMVALPLS
jgi:5-formyltetrahydrofolate cyclo-ligase